jgi:hypothetical protein
VHRLICSLILIGVVLIVCGCAGGGSSSVPAAGSPEPILQEGDPEPIPEGGAPGEETPVEAVGGAPKGALRELRRVEARLEKRFRERNGPDAVGCERAGSRLTASGKEVWQCEIITHSGGFRAHLELGVDPRTGNYSILNCRRVPERGQMPPTVLCSEYVR